MTIANDLVMGVRVFARLNRLCSYLLTTGGNFEDVRDRARRRPSLPNEDLPAPVQLRSNGGLLVASGLLAERKEFLPVDRYVAWRFDAEADLAAIDVNDRD